MKKVLMIEDDQALKDVYKLALSDVVEYNGAKDGKEGLEKIRSIKPDLIILDIMLPGGMNGFDILEEIKKDPAVMSIPVLVLTNLDTEEKVAREIGAVEYLVKANTPIEKVVDKVSSLLKI